MDFLALYICARFLHITLKPFRLIAASAVGGIYAVLFTAFEFGKVGALGGFISLISGAACALVMVGIGFGARRFAAVKATFTYAAVNVGLGGVMTAIYSFAGRMADSFGIRQTVQSQSASSVFFVFAALLSGVISLIYGKYREKTLRCRKVSAQITVLGKQREFELLCDSGNLLREPFHGKPVIIVSADSFEGIPELEHFKGDYSSGEESLYSAMYRLKAGYIPVSGVTGKGTLIYFCPDRICVDGKNLEAAVAIDSSGNNYNGCDGIIPQILITA